MIISLKKKVLFVICLFAATLFVTNPVKTYAGSWGFTGEGWYNLTPKCASGKYLDIQGGSTKNKANVQIYEYNNTNSQRFYFSSVGNGYYVISSMLCNKVLDIKNNSKKSGANVQQYDFKYGDNQLWKVVSEGNGYYSLRPCRNTSLALDVNRCGSANGTNVQVYTYKRNNTAQMWRFWKGTTSKGYTFIPSIKQNTASYSVNPSGNSKFTVWAITQPVFSSGPYKPVGASKLRVIITQASTGKTIMNKVVSGKANTFSINKKYGAYTVTVSREGEVVWNGFNCGFYSTISLVNARIK